MPHSTFDGFGLPAKLAHALRRIHFTTPTPIQAQAIPLALEGKDILGSAQTGTGKTGAFGIPVIAGMMEDPEAMALIMTPTRELASQIVDALTPMIPTADIRTALLIGGESMPRQLRQLDRKPRLIVGTPGRINDHLERGNLKLDRVRYLVLDETDRMLDMGFGIQIERILKHVPAERQTLLFSATLPPNIGKLSSRYMRDPVRIAAGPTTTPAANIKQEMISVTDANKYDTLVEQLKQREGSIIVFAKTKWGTQKLSDRLNKDGHRSDAIHGDLQQRRRDRVIQNFRDERYRILVATDVAARGLDIPHIAHVINYDVPQAPEDYIHRIGRTARAGAEGEAVSFVTPADNAKWRAVQRLMKIDMPNDGSRDKRDDHSTPRNGKRRNPAWKHSRPKPAEDRPQQQNHKPRPAAEQGETARPQKQAHKRRRHAPYPIGDASGPRPHKHRRNAA
jgi:superfamily II DNA/RNA helicase